MTVCLSSGSVNAAMAARAIACLDLTNLDEACSPADIEALCARARTPAGPVAAVCVWSRYASLARDLLAGSGIRIATVAAFPDGMSDMGQLGAEIATALRAGADEIDIVIPWRDVLSGRFASTEAAMALARTMAGKVTLKAILETGALAGADHIRNASMAALAGGADFLKTSTGRHPVGATPSAAHLLLEAISASGQDAGLKPSGGISTPEAAAAYLGLADAMMGPGRATPERFRIGASGVLTKLLAVIDGRDAAHLATHISY